jgi:hypothetical protein
VTSVGRTGERTGAVALAFALGCVPIRSESVVEVHEKRDARPVVLGAPAGHVSARGLAAKWTQRGTVLEVELRELRRCSALEHVPVVRVERITRTAGAAPWVELGAGAAMLALGIVGFARPELFGQRAINSAGEVVEDRASGYRVGGIFTGIGSLLVIGGIVDAVRARDEVRYAEAYRTRLGPEVECPHPEIPLAGRDVELVAGDVREPGQTNASGHVRFELPPELDRPPDPSGMVEIRRAALRLGVDRAVVIDYVVPLSSEAAREFAGESQRRPRDGRRTVEVPTR